MLLCLFNYATTFKDAKHNISMGKLEGFYNKIKVA